MKKHLSDSTIYIILVVIICIFGVSAQVLTNTKIESSVDASLEYKEDASINYQVHYSDNPFYTDAIIPEGKTYVQEYVDKIGANFSYDVEYNDKLTNGSYDYYVIAKLIAYTPGGNEEDDLWTKEYKLSDVESINVIEDSNYHIEKTVDIDYHMYKNDFDNYKNLTGINASAKLIIEFIVNNRGEYAGVDNFEYASSSKMEMPLGDSTFKIKTSKTANGDLHKIVKFSETDHEKMYMKIIVILLWVLAIFTAIVLIIVIKFNRNKLSFYEKILRKILLSYDDIIVDVEKLPSLSSLSVVSVTTFDELLDAQSEVSSPINFYEDKKKKVAKFVLIHDNLAWVYTLDEENLIKDTK